MTDFDPYTSLGVRRRINAAGALTRLGGAVMAPEVMQAMAAASRASVDIGELQDAASARIAEATGAGDRPRLGLPRSPHAAVRPSLNAKPFRNSRYRLRHQTIARSQR